MAYNSINSISMTPPSIKQELEQLTQEEKIALSILLDIQKYPDSVMLRRSNENKQLPIPNNHTPRKQKQTMSFKLYCETIKPFDQHNKNLIMIGANKPKTVINTKSKKIMQRKEKEGKKYKPIHLRASDELRKKFDHICELRAQMKSAQEKTLLECTFTPSIIKTEKTLARNPKDFVKQLYRQRKRQHTRQNEDMSQQFALLNRSLDLKTTTERQMSICSNSKQKLFGKCLDHKKSRDYVEVVNRRPNKTFNILLDIIK